MVQKIICEAISRSVPLSCPDVGYLAPAQDTSGYRTVDTIDTPHRGMARAPEHGAVCCEARFGMYRNYRVKTTTNLRRGWFNDIGIERET